MSAARYIDQFASLSNNKNRKQWTATTPNLPGHLLTFAGRSLIGPADAALWPFVEAMRWHRTEVFHG